MTSINQGHCEKCLGRFYPGARVIEVRIVTLVNPFNDDVTTDRFGLMHMECPE